MIDPECQLSNAERAELVALTRQDGFKVLQKIFEMECAKFQVKLINTDAANRDAVIAAHNLAKASAQYYAGIISRLNNEVAIYTSAPGLAPEPDITEELLRP